MIHGTADPRFPVEHGQALAEEIPGATLLLLDGAGHGVDCRLDHHRARHPPAHRHTCSRRRSPANAMSAAPDSALYGDAMKGRCFDHALGQVDSASSTVRDNAARPIPLLAWTAMPLLKATM